MYRAAQSIYDAFPAIKYVFMCFSNITYLLIKRSAFKT